VQVLAAALLLLLALPSCQAASKQQCASRDGSCSDDRDYSPESGEWYGEFFPDIPKIK
jgi:hypothetical protein